MPNASTPFVAYEVVTLLEKPDRKFTRLQRDVAKLKKDVTKLSEKEVTGRK